MNDQQKKEQDSGVRDQEIRAALDQHWAASDANDFETEHRIYLEAREFAGDTALCGLQHHCREQRLTPETR